MSRYRRVYVNIDEIALQDRNRLTAARTCRSTAVTINGGKFTEATALTGRMYIIDLLLIIRAWHS